MYHNNHVKPTLSLYNQIQFKILKHENYIIKNNNKKVKNLLPLFLNKRSLYVDKNINFVRELIYSYLQAGIRGTVACKRHLVRIYFRACALTKWRTRWVDSYAIAYLKSRPHGGWHWKRGKVVIRSSFWITRAFNDASCVKCCHLKKLKWKLCSIWPYFLYNFHTVFTVTKRVMFTVSK